MYEQDLEVAAAGIEIMNRDIRRLAKKSLSAEEISKIDSEYWDLNLAEKIVVVMYRLHIDFRATPQQCLSEYVGNIERDGAATLFKTNRDLLDEFHEICELLRMIVVNFFEEELYSFGPYKFLHIESTVFVYRTVG